MTEYISCLILRSKIENGLWVRLDLGSNSQLVFSVLVAAKPPNSARLGRAGVQGRRPCHTILPKAKSSMLCLPANCIENVYIHSAFLQEKRAGILLLTPTHLAQIKCCLDITLGKSVRRCAGQQSLNRQRNVLAKISVL